MKKIILLLLPIVLFASSCEKMGGTLQQGTYSASTSSGMLNIELLPNEKCILYFTGGPEESGYYHIKGNKIEISANVYTTDNWGSSKWDVYLFRSDNPGTIHNNTSFSINAESSKKEKMVYCSFVKRK